MAVNPLRIAFMGTPDFIVPVLVALNQSAHDLVCVYTQPPRPKGRGQSLHKSAAQEWAEAKNIPVRTPADFKNHKDIDEFKALNLDAAVVAAYGMLLPENILKAPQYGCINIHPSLLPRWRGTSPVQFAIWTGDEETGISIMQLVRKMDAGPVIAQKRLQMPPRATYETLNLTLWNKSADMIVEALDGIAQRKSVMARPQDESGITFTKMFSKDDGKIDWSQTAEQIDRQIRALNPWPGVWSTLENKNVKILETIPDSQTSDQPPGLIINRQGHVVCGGGTVLKVLKIQPENARHMDFPSAANGGHIKAGDQFR